MLRANRTKAKLLAGELCLGAVVPLPSPELVELSAAVGFDFVTIDTEQDDAGPQERRAAARPSRRLRSWSSSD